VLQYDFAAVASVQIHCHQRLSPAYRLKPEGPIGLGINGIGIESRAFCIVQFAQSEPFAIEFVEIFYLPAVQFGSAQFGAHAFDTNIAEPIRYIFGGFCLRTLRNFCFSGFRIDDFSCQTIFDGRNPGTNFFLRQMISRHHHHIVLTRQPVDNISASQVIADCVSSLFLRQQLRLASVCIDREHVG